MTEFKIEPYSVQKLDYKTLTPKGNKKIMYCVMKKIYPFPSKPVFLQETIKDGLKTELDAVLFLKSYLSL